MLLRVPVHCSDAGCLTTAAAFSSCGLAWRRRTDHGWTREEGSLGSRLCRGTNWRVRDVSHYKFSVLFVTPPANLSSSSTSTTTVPPMARITSPTAVPNSTLPLWKKTPGMNMKKPELFNIANAKEEYIIRLRRKNSKSTRPLQHPRCCSFTFNLIQQRNERPR